MIKIDEFKENTIYEFFVYDEEDLEKKTVKAHYMSVCVSFDTEGTESVKFEDNTDIAVFDDVGIIMDEIDDQGLTADWVLTKYHYNVSIINEIGHIDDHPEYKL